MCLSIESERNPAKVLALLYVSTQMQADVAGSSGGLDLRLRGRRVTGRGRGVSRDLDGKRRCCYTRASQQKVEGRSSVRTRWRVSTVLSHHEVQVESVLLFSFLSLSACLLKCLDFRLPSTSVILVQLWTNMMVGFSSFIKWMYFRVRQLWS